MVFSSFKFIFIFLPIFFLCYYLVSEKMRNSVLLLGSLCFYGIGTIHYPDHFIVFLFSILLDYGMGRLIAVYEKKKKLFLMIDILFHIGILFYFKYAAFLIKELNQILPGPDIVLTIVLPIGISFYTFQGISYLVDVYRGKVEAEKNLIDFMAYIAMFEQLIAGPIVTYGQVKGQLKERRLNKSKIRWGGYCFILGLGLKVLLANPLGKFWNQVGAIGYESISTPLAWMSILAFSFQIYFDFWGYSLMALGLGKMMGFTLPENFSFPYLSLSMSEFWRRWHMTLGNWFREYVYIPLGGNRKNKWLTVRNLLIVWILTGIWHGAGYNFLLWGLILAGILIVEKFWLGKYLNKYPALGHFYMMVVIPLTWAVFGIEDIHSMGIFFSRLFPFFGQGVWSVFSYDYLKYLKLYGPFLLAGIFFSTKIPFLFLLGLRKKNIKKMIFAVIFLACVFCIYLGMDDPFLYFRF